MGPAIVVYVVGTKASLDNMDFHFGYLNSDVHSPIDEGKGDSQQMWSGSHKVDNGFID
jgi:hypothetical protein